MSAYDDEDLYDEDLINEIENQKHATSNNAPCGDEDYIPDDLFQDQQTTTTTTKKRLSDDGGANGGAYGYGEKKTRIEDPVTSQKKSCLADYFTTKTDPVPAPVPAPSPSIPTGYGSGTYGSSTGPAGYGSGTYGSSTGPEVMEIAPKCQCGTECLKKTVVKEGPNKGRGFWTCPNGGPGTQAHLFEWCDEGTKSGPGTTTSQNYDGNGGVPPVVASTGSGPPCKCGQASVQRTVQKEGPNKNRLFHTCPNPQGSQCGFFEWAAVDQPSNNNGPPKTTSSNYGGGGGGGYGNGSSQFGQGGGSQGAMGSGGGGETSLNMLIALFL